MIRVDWPTSFLMGSEGVSLFPLFFGIEGSAPSAGATLTLLVMGQKEQAFAAASTVFFCQGVLTFRFPPWVGRGALVCFFHSPKGLIPFFFFHSVFFGLKSMSVITIRSSVFCFCPPLDRRSPPYFPFLDYASSQRLHSPWDFFGIVPICVGASRLQSTCDGFFFVSIPLYFPA